MEYYSVQFEPGQRLGISVIARSDADPKLGHTVVEAAEPNGHGAKFGVKAGDFITTVNGEYVAHLQKNICVQRLQSVMESIKQTGRAMIVEFCRPQALEWSRIQQNGRTVICEGILQKQVGLLRRWNSRLFKLTRESLTYCGEGEVSRKAFSVESISLSRVYRPGSNLVELSAGGKDLCLEAESELMANRWKHALDCAITRAFDIDLPAKYTQVFQHSTPPPIPPKPKPSFGPLDTSYLEIGRQHNGTPTLPARPQPRQVGHHNPTKNPYWMLLLCKLRISSGPGGAVDISNVPDPSKIQLRRVDYTFGLENTVLRDASKPH